MRDKAQTLTDAVIEARDQHENNIKQRACEEKDAGSTRDVRRQKPESATKTEKKDEQE